MSARGIYDMPASKDPSGIAYRLHELCKVGAAATDTTLNIDLSKDGYRGMFETMAELCENLIDQLETQARERKQ